MFVIGGVVVGAVLGVLSAKRQGGKRADMAQYAAAHAIVLGILGLIVTLVIDRMM